MKDSELSVEEYFGKLKQDVMAIKPAKRRFKYYVDRQVQNAKDDGWESVAIWSHITTDWLEISINQFEKYIMEYRNRYKITRRTNNSNPLVFYLLEWS